MCTYGKAADLAGILSVVLRPAGGKSALADDKIVDRQGVDLAGVGDAAYGVFNAGNATVSFYRGDTYASILLSFPETGASAHKDQTIALAKSAAGRI